MSDGLLDENGLPVSAGASPSVEQRLAEAVEQRDGYARMAENEAASVQALSAQLAEAVDLLREIVPEYRQLIEECGHDPSVGIDCSADFDRIERIDAFLAEHGGEE